MSRKQHNKFHVRLKTVLLFSVWIWLCSGVSAQNPDIIIPHEDNVIKTLTSADLPEGSNLKNYGCINIDGDSPIRLNSYSHLSGDGYYGVTVPTLVAHTDVSALSAELLQMGWANYNDWYFTSVPFNVKVRDVVVDTESQYLIRIYDGRRRAALKSDTWRTLTADDEIKAGQGFILHWEKDDPNIISTISFKGEPSTGTLFAKDDVLVELESYPSELRHTDSWNHIANPYPCYFNIKYIEHDGLLTFWNTDYKRYDVYSPIDDDVYIPAFRSFFVQKTSDSPVIFHKEGRRHNSNGTGYESPRQNPCLDYTRQVYNLYLTRAGRNDYFDRARVVINTNASDSYDKRRDAPKFESLIEGSAEIYVRQDGLKMAIDERPFGSGIAVVGVKIPESGDYIIELSGRFEEGCMIEDTKIGIFHDFRDGAYHFNSEAGDFGSRFRIHFDKSAGKAEIFPDKQEQVRTYSSEGLFMGNGRVEDLDLHDGVYIEKTGTATRKILKR